MSLLMYGSDDATSGVCRTIDKVDIFGDNSGKALYRLDGNANDTGGNYHGTETAITYGSGVYDRCAIGNGTSSGVIFSTPIPTTTNMTISYWIKSNQTTPYRITDGTTTANSCIISSGSSAYGGIPANSLAFMEGDNTANRAYISFTSDLLLHHVCISITGTLVEFYIDNTPKTVTSNLNTRSLMGIKSLMGVTTLAGHWLNGSLDQVRIFNRAITAAEVATLYAECAPTSIVDNANPFEDNSLKVMYQFNGNANDLTGVYNGTATNVTYAAGKFGDCAVFNGASSTVVSSSFPSIGVDSSVAAWVNTATTSAQSIAEWSNGTNLIALYYDSTTFKVRINALLYSVTSTIPKNVFVHVCVTILNNVPRLSVNGIYMTLTNSAVTAIAGTSGLRVGVANIATVQTYMNGSIDQIRFFTKQLTPMEVAALYNETTPLEEPLAALVDPFKDGSGKALYRLEGNALDESGNYNGTATALTYGNSSNGRCAVFNGTSSYISSTTATLGVSTFSYSLWVNPSTVSTTAKHMIDFVTNRCALTNGNGTTSVVSYYDGAYKSFTYTLTASVTTHLVLVVVGTSATLFADGVSQGTITVTSLSPSGGVRLGSNSTNNGLWYAGNEDQVRFFNRALTQVEITQLFNAGA